MGFNSCFSIIHKVFKTDIGLYCLLFILSVHINKYVLSILGFTYPTVYQGWQTFVSVCILLFITPKLSSDDESSQLKLSSVLRQLPEVLLYLATLVTGSKALASAPVALFVSVQNVPTICCLMFCLNQTPCIEFLTAITGLVSSLCLLIFSTDSISEEGQFWLIWYCISAMMSDTFFQVDENYNKEINKMYYKNVFSVVMLGPVSFYIGEAFSALEFRPSQRLGFYAGCLASGGIAILLQLATVRLKRKQLYARTSICSRVPAALLSLLVFPGDILSLGLWHLLFVNVTSSLLLAFLVTNPHQVTTDSAPQTV